MAVAAGCWLGLCLCGGVSWRCFAARCVWCLRCPCLGCWVLCLQRLCVCCFVWRGLLLPSPDHWFQPSLQLEPHCWSPHRWSSPCSLGHLSSVALPSLSSIAAALWCSCVARKSSTVPVRLTMVVQGLGAETSLLGEAGCLN